MSKEAVFALVTGIAVGNGIFNPYAKGFLLTWWRAWYPEAIVPLNFTIVTYLASLLIAGTTLALAGIPSALYEKLTGRRESDGISLGIWLVAALALSFPAIEFVVGQMARQS